MLADAALFFSSLHTLGAALGAGGVTFAELWYLKSIADGKVDTCEERHIRGTFFALRYGMSIMLLSALGLVYLEYFVPTSPQHIEYASFWMTQLITLVIILSGFLLSRRLAPLWLVGSLALAGWWMILILDASHGASFTFSSLFWSYVFATALVAAVLVFTRNFVHVHRRLKS